VSRDRAERLVSYVEDAEEALQRALRAASGFPKEERVRFSELLYETIAALNSDVWKPIYDAYPTSRRNTRVSSPQLSTAN